MFFSSLELLRKISIFSLLYGWSIVKFCIYIGKANNKVNLSRFQREWISVAQVSTALPMLRSHYKESFF